ncbi:MAG: CoA transferase [Chloroflexi bacterium]|nr:CoA transferase [Chloroflexota bacterium]
MNQSRPLEGVRVVDLGRGIPGAFTGKLLGALGAQVVKVEPPDGDPLRKQGPFPQDLPHSERSGLFLYLNTGKQGVTLDLSSESGRTLFLRLAAWADIIVEDLAPKELPSLGLGYDVLQQANPRLIVTSITPFGQSGPYRDYRGSEIGMHAISGEMSVAGSSGHPLKKGGEMTHYFGGLNGFIGTMGALLRRDQTGQGCHVDVSLAEGFTAIIGGMTREQSYTGKPAARGGRGEERIRLAKDGYSLVFTRGGSDWATDFAAIMGRPDLAPDTSASAEEEAKRQEEFEAAFTAWLLSHTPEEVYHAGQEHRQPFGYIATAPNILASPQLAHRGFLERVHHPAAGTVILPALPFLLGGERWLLGRAPLLGEHNEAVYGGLLGLSRQEIDGLRAEGVIGPGTPQTPSSRSSERHTAVTMSKVSTMATAAETQHLPLEGIRVLDFSIIWAGPVCCRILGDLGAEVIKVESINRMDPGRGPVVVPANRRSTGYPDGVPGERPYNRSGRTNEYAANKLGLTLDLRQPEGLKAARELVRESDLVVENFSAGVMERMGLGYEELRRLRPDIILLSMQGWGSTGPEANYVAYGSVQEAMSGFSSITGDPGGPPTLTGVHYGDPTGGTVGAASAMMALWRRHRTGRGMHIDLSQREAALMLLPELLLEYQFNKRILGPQGNRHPSMAPHGCYQCRGEDSWIVIAVEDEAHWRTLCQVMGHSEIATDRRFSTLPARLQHQDALDEVVAGWTRDYEHYPLMHRLQQAGIAAHALLNTAELMKDPHYLARGYFQSVTHPEAGTHPHVSQGLRFTADPLPVRRSAPCLGEHNELILGDLLGLTAEALRQLKDKGVIGTKPVASQSR